MLKPNRMYACSSKSSNAAVEPKASLVSYRPPLRVSEPGGEKHRVELGTRGTRHASRIWVISKYLGTFSRSS